MSVRPPAITPKKIGAAGLLVRLTCLAFLLSLPLTKAGAHAWLLWEQSVEQPIPAAVSNPDRPQELEAFLDGVMNEQLKDYNIPGATVSVVRNGRIVFAKGYGYADLAQRKPIVADRTLFGPGSIAKIFTWTAVMQLVEQGRLDLNTDVNLYLEDFQIPATYPQPITLMHLMTHCAGFDDPYNFYTRNAAELVLLREAVSRSLPPRVRPPGELSTYSNYGTALAGRIVEQASGLPFEQYVEDHILAPLNMQHTTIRQPLAAPMQDDLTVGYTSIDGGYQSEPFVYIHFSPAGSMLTTATDMAHFMIAYLEDGQFGNTAILQPDTARRMQQQLYTNDPEASGWAYGLMEMNLNDQRLLWHIGDTPLYHSLLVLSPEHHLGLFVAYNGQGGTRARMELLQALFDHYFPISTAAPIEPVANPSQSPDRYAGSYRLIPRASATFEKAKMFVQNQVDVRLDQNGVLRLAGLGVPAHLIEVRPRVFRLPLLDGQPNRAGEVVFREENTGRITHFFLANEPLTVYEKISWYETKAFNYALLSVCVVLFASMLLTPLAPRRCYSYSSFRPKSSRPGSARSPRQIRGVSHGMLAQGAAPAGSSDKNYSNGPRLAYRLACSLSALNLVFLVGILITLNRPYVTTHEIIPFLMPLLTVALVAASLAIGAAAATLLVWKGRYWNLAARLHYTLVALAAVAFMWWLHYWNLLGLRL